MDTEKNSSPLFAEVQGQAMQPVNDSSARGDMCFTWAPSPSFHKLSIKDQFDETYKHLKKMSKCTQNCKVYPELTANGNIHYHGIFTITDNVKWFKSVLPTFKRNGFVKIVKINEHYRDKWVKYIVKERANMLQILELPDKLFGMNGLNLQYRKVPKGDIPLEPVVSPKWYEMGEIKEPTGCTISFTY